MMKLRDDIVLKKIDSVYALIALKSAWEDCPFAIQIAPYAAIIWKDIKHNKKKEEIIDDLMTSKGFNREKAEKLYSCFMDAAENYHYFIEDENNG